MSLRRFTNKKYKRPIFREDTDFWLELFLDDEVSGWDWWLDEYPAWFDMFEGCDGHVTSMSELYQMRLLTLLRSLSLRTPMLILKERGW